MKKILSLCINLLLLMISDAVPLKLIAGDRSVVKKDGATHRISKYYVVPNDYDPNIVTDTTAATQKESLRIHSLYSESMDSGSINEEISENNATTVNHQSDDDADVNVEKNNDQLNFRADLNVGQGEVTNQPDNSTETTTSTSTEPTLDSDDLGNLQVVPIINPINISHIVTDNEIDTNVNSSEAVQNQSALIVENVTYYQNIEDALDDSILSKFRIAVRDIYSQNLESFWKLIKINIDKELGDDELLAAIEQLFLLLNIFTNLYEAAQTQQPVEKMIDGIVEILQKPFVEKSNRDESPSEINISGGYGEECLKKCGQKSSKPQLDSNSTYLSEAEASNSLELENLQRRQTSDSDDNDLIKITDDPDSNKVTVSNEPTNVLRNQLPYNLNVANSIQNIPVSTETVENRDDLDELRFADVLPLTIKSRTADDVPWTIDDETTEYFPWNIPTTPNDDLPWHIEDKKHHPFSIKHRTSNKVPWKIDRTARTWTIGNKKGHLPITTLYQSSDPSVTTHGSNILLNPNQSIKTTVHSVQNGIKKPYHIYTYVIKPTATLHKVPNAGNVVQVLSKQPYENLKTPLYGLPTLHVENKVVYKNQPPQSHYESQYSFSKPTNDINRLPSYSQVPHHVFTSYGQSHEVNPSTHTASASFSSGDPRNSGLISASAASSTYTNGLDVSVNGGQVYQQPGAISTASANSKYTIVQNDNDVPIQVHRGDTNNYPGYIDQPVYGGQEYQQPGAISTASANSKYTITQNDNDVPTQVHGGDINNYPGYIDHPVYGGIVYQPPVAISTASANSKYTIVQNDNDVPIQVHEGDTNNYPGYIDQPVYGGQEYQQPGAISTASANSKYTIVENDNDVPTQVHGGDTNNYPGYIDQPVYGGQGYQQPGAISTASANSKYTITQNDNDVPTQVHGGDTNNYPGYIDQPVYGGQVYQQPGAISTASANSKYTIVQNYNDVPTQVLGEDTNNYPGYIDQPVYGGQVYQQPVGISTATANSKYTIVQNDNDVPTQIHVGDTNNYPGYISKATSNSEYTNVPIDYGYDTNKQPGLISEVHQHPVYPNVVNGLDDSIPVNGVQIQKHPSYISKASVHSEFTIPVNYKVSTHDYKVPIDIHPVKTQNVPDYPVYTKYDVNHYIKVHPVKGGPTQNGDNHLVPYQPYEHSVHIIHQPSLIETISGNQNLKLAPTYRLFTLQNLQNLENAIIKTIQMHGPGLYDTRALINLKNIINVILLLADNLEKTDGTNAWYEKIFYNTENSQHPLQHYVYNLIRQRWLHELMLVLYKNNFSIHILENPGMFSFLESWELPEYIQNFMEADELMHVPNPQNYNDISNNQNDLQHKISIHTYDDLLEVPTDLAKYVTKKVIHSYKTPNEGIVLSIAGVEAEPDADAIINILQNYLHYKNNIGTQENVIVRNKKVEILKQIIFFLREKGYGPKTIADLIRKLYTAVYSTEGKAKLVG